MRVRVVLFAVCRERAKSDQISVELPDTGATAADVLRAVERAAPALSEVLPAVRVAVNLAFVEPDHPIGANDEVALIPPVSGGAPEAGKASEGTEGPLEVWAALGEEPLDPREVEAQVAGSGQGARVTFQGTVRNRTGDHGVVALEYEAYPAMALAVLRQIGNEGVRGWPGARVAVAHRTGRLTVGEVSVVICVSHPHRAQAFEACRHVIERLKQDVPIWKKEIREDGSVWVGIGS